MSCCSEYPKALTLAFCFFSLITTHLRKVIGRHSSIKFHSFADDTQFFVQPLKNSCLQDIQEWMSISILKLNPDKMKFIIFGSHVQLKKLDSCLPVRIFVKFMHPSVVVKNLDIWFDANFSFADHVCNIYETYVIQMHYLRQVRQYLMHEAVIVIWTTATHLLEVYPVLAYTNCSVFKANLVGLSQTTIDTQMHILFSMNSIGSKLN